VGERVVAIVQARMGSTRLPAKVLEDIAGQPMLARVVERAGRAERVDEVVVATSLDPDDAPIEALCRARGWACFRGSLHDVLDRYRGAARMHEADTIVRVTSDCPLIDPGTIDDVVARRAAQDGGDDGCDYASNTIEPRTFPRGLDAEAFTADALDSAWRDDRDPASREHVTPFLYRHPDRFRLLRVSTEPDRSWMRWTVDVAEDLELVRILYAETGTDAPWIDVALAMESHPEWGRLNRHVEQRTVPDPRPR
jgi:spore coat polysaccharide biosynthesis protein SpsF